MENKYVANILYKTPDPESEGGDDDKKGGEPDTEQT